MSKSHSKPIQTLQLTSKEKQRAVMLMNSGCRSVPITGERRALRVDYPAEQLIVSIMHPNRLCVTYSVIPRNLSRWGVAFIHGRFVYPNSPVTMLMPMQNGSWCQVEGKVVRCRHVSGMMHEVSVCFAEAVDLSEFVTLDDAQMEALQHEVAMQYGPEAVAASAKGERGEQRALILGATVADGHLMQHWLSQVGVSGRCVENAEALAAEVRGKAPDLVLVDLGHDESGRGTIIRRLRNEFGFVGSVLATSADESEPVQRKAIRDGADSFLAKPFDVEALQHAVELLEVQRGAAGIASAGSQESEPIYSSLVQDHEMRPLIAEFVRNLSSYGDGLTQSLSQSDRTALHRLCLDLKGSGSGYGFACLTHAAKLVLAQMQRDQNDVAAMHAQVTELIDLIKRVKYE